MAVSRSEEWDRQQVSQPMGSSKGYGLNPEPPEETVQNLLGRTCLALASGVAGWLTRLQGLAL